MRSRILVCSLVLAAGCSDDGSGTVPGSTSGGGGLTGATTRAPSTGGTSGTTSATTATTSSTTAGTSTSGGQGPGTTTTGGTDPGTTGTTGGSTTGGTTDTTAGPTTTGGGVDADGGATSTTGGATGQTTASADGGDTGMATGMATGMPEPQTCTGSGQPGRSAKTVDVGGVTREYTLYVPDSYTGDAPVPLMVAFHPLLNDAGFAENRSGFKELADREGFIAAFPNNLEDAAWNVGGVCCTTDREIDDEGFARALVEQVKSEYCVDAKRVYASGFSMGGGMSHYLACSAADVFAAVAPSHFDLFDEIQCEPSRPISVYISRSRSDFIVPYDGGPKTSAPNGFRGTHTFPGAVEGFEGWAETNGCTGSPVSRSGGCEVYEQCEGGVEVTLCTVGGGHSYPPAADAWNAIKGFSLP